MPTAAVPSPLATTVANQPAEKTKLVFGGAVTPPSMVHLPPYIAKDMGYELELEAAVKSMKAMLKRGIRVLPGGDYGFAWAPHGENAKDLEYFVKYLGMTPMETLISATRWGGQIMMRKDLGEIREGWLADLLLVDGDPVANISILQDRSKLLAIMKDGEFAKAPEIRSARSRFVA